MNRARNINGLRGGFWREEKDQGLSRRGVIGAASLLPLAALGGTRMGDNPETNVVNRWGFSHEAPNLGMLGASVMGASGARNPTLTVQALSW